MVVLFLARVVLHISTCHARLQVRHLQPTVGPAGQHAKVGDDGDDLGGPVLTHPRMTDAAAKIEFFHEQLTRVARCIVIEALRCRRGVGYAG